MEALPQWDLLTRGSTEMILESEADMIAGVIWVSRLLPCACARATRMSGVGVV